MIKNILFDFDGVLIDSMSVREEGFRRIFRSFDKQNIEKLLVYHRENGGLSRFHKIRYFYETILQISVSNEKVQELADRFSKFMRITLIDKAALINDSLEFIYENRSKYRFHIVSGSEQSELRYLCDVLEISDLFLSINGSPRIKNYLVSDILNKFRYDKRETVIIGDSVNDYHAAIHNEIKFFGYNNTKLKELGVSYIDRLSQPDTIYFNNH